LDQLREREEPHRQLRQLELSVQDPVGRALHSALLLLRLEISVSTALMELVAVPEVLTKVKLAQETMEDFTAVAVPEEGSRVKYREMEQTELSS
jgi:hypothetical protein